MAGKKKVKNLVKALKDCEIASDHNPDLVFAESYDQELLSKWPKNKKKVPDIFLHKPADFAKHVRKVLSLGIQFYHPYHNRNSTKIMCLTHNDHKALIQYFEAKQLPYHTFGHPSKAKMRVVIRGLPNDTELSKLKAELKLGGIPIIRVHKMHRRPNIKDNKALILAVVPYDEEGKRILLLKKIFGYDIRMEPPENKTKQCHRCQRWGHTQRYCHGKIRCVRCAGDHLSKKCENDLSEMSPKCANCCGNHTASYRECPCCPDSLTHQLNALGKLNKEPKGPIELVTFENCDTLYKNIIYLPVQKF